MVRQGAAFGAETPVRLPLKGFDARFRGFQTRALPELARRRIVIERAWLTAVLRWNLSPGRARPA